jgi:hypothetical protein
MAVNNSTNITAPGDGLCNNNGTMLVSFERDSIYRYWLLCSCCSCCCHHATPGKKSKIFNAGSWHTVEGDALTFASITRVTVMLLSADDC